MGTSTSSKGGSSRSPFDPEWLSGDACGDGDAGVGLDGAEISDTGEDKPSPDQLESGNSESAETVGSGEAVPVDAEPIPNRRFAEARTKMTAYLAGGDRQSLRSAAKSMVNKGMGGPKRAARTMSGTAQGAGQLGQFLVSARDGIDPRVIDWVDRVREANLSANDLTLELIKEVLPDTGSIDDESLRNAAAEALGKLYEANPNIDIFKLTDQQISDVIGFTIANEVCNRMDLQLGQTYERLKYKPQQVQLYRNDVKEYVHAEVRVVMERLTASKLAPQRLAREVLASTLKVFAA